MEKNRNYFIAIALSVVIVLAWQFLYMNPRLEAQRRAEEARLASQGKAKSSSRRALALNPAYSRTAPCLPAHRLRPRSRAKNLLRSPHAS